MKNCKQNESQSIWDHGSSVQTHYLELIDILNNLSECHSWKLPNWIFEYKDQILKSLLPIEIIKEYTLYHDCGKPYCLTIDENCKRHFPNHAEMSAKTWREIDGDEQIARLIEKDMFIHTCKPYQIDEFLANYSNGETITLLLAALSEIHSNSTMFGGCNSDSFKTKYKKIDKIGKMICQKLFKKGIKNDLDEK